MNGNSAPRTEELQCSKQVNFRQASDYMYRLVIKIYSVNDTVCNYR